MNSELPRALKYLKQVIKDIEEVEEDELDESYDISRLLALLRKRIKGLNLEEARERISNDHRELVKWLEVKGEHPAIFIETIMAQPELAEHLLAESSEPKSARAKKKQEALVLQGIQDRGRAPATGSRSPARHRMAKLPPPRRSSALPQTTRPCQLQARLRSSGARATPGQILHP
jgi:hypothetical protein